MTFCLFKDTTPVLHLKQEKWLHLQFSMKRIHLQLCVRFKTVFPKFVISGWPVPLKFSIFVHLMFFFQYYCVSQIFFGNTLYFPRNSNILFSIAVARERRKERGRKWQRGIRRLGQISTRNRWNSISLLKIFFTHFLPFSQERDERAQIKSQRNTLKSSPNNESEFLSSSTLWYLPSETSNLQHSMFFNMFLKLHNFCPKIVIYASCVHNISHSYQRCQ